MPRDATVACGTCEAPARRLWSFARHPPFTRVEAAGWAVLDRCPDCLRLWCSVAYEPHAAFTFWAAWDDSAASWRQSATGEGAIRYFEWHEAVLAAEYPRLAPAEQDAVDEWRRRAYGRTPLDRRRD